MQPEISAIGSLIGNPSRAIMLTALMGGKALTATELAVEAEISAQTATSHLNQLIAGKLLIVRKQGRHKYFQLANYLVADMLESLLTVSVQLAIPYIPTGPNDPALKYARVCYDHLAGELGVKLYNSLKKQNLILDYGEETNLTDTGRQFFTEQGFDFDPNERRKRPLCKSCLDWSERTNHLAGALGKWILDDLFSKGIVSRELDSRALRLNGSGLKKMAAMYKI